MKLTIYILSAMLLFAGCNDEKSNQVDSTNEDKDISKKNDSTNLANTSSLILAEKITRVYDSIKEIQTSTKNEVYYKRSDNIKSYPHFLKNYFTEGSDKTHVMRLQGMPDVTEDLDANNETWFYGNCEVSFSYDKVENVVNGNECVRFVPVDILLTSTDPKLNEIGKRILENDSRRRRR